MKKYFSIHNSLNEENVGKIPQVKKIIHNCNVWEEPFFIDKYPFKKIKFKPILSNVILYSQSKETDLIEAGGIGFSYGSILISNKLKELLSQFNCFGIQFFSTHITHKGKEINTYWQTHIYDIPYDFLNFQNTEFLLKDRDENRKPIQSIIRNIDKSEFSKMLITIKYPKMLFLKNISFIKKMDFDYFFFPNIEGTNKGIVSEC